MGYYDYVNSLPEPLSKEEQDILLRRFYATRDEEARRLLIEHNLRLAASCVKKTIYNAGDLDDYMQYATIELVNVLDNKFDINKGIQFSTFAYASIQKRLIGICSRLSKDVNRKREEYERYRELEDIGFFEEKEDVEEEIIDDLTRQKEKELIADYVSSLDERDRYIIEHAYGLNGKEIKSSQEIAKDLDRTYALVNSKLLKMKSELKDSLSCNFEVPELDELQKVLHYYDRTTNSTHRYIIANYYGLFGKPRKSLKTIAKVLKLGEKAICKLMVEIKGCCGLIDTHIEITEQDYIDYMATSSSKLECELIEYYLGLNGKDKISLYGIADELGLQYYHIYNKLDSLKNKILRLKHRQAIYNKKQLISMEDLLKYYQSASPITQHFMDIVYGLNGYEKTSMEECAKMLKITVDELVLKKKMVEDCIKENVVVERETE